MALTRCLPCYFLQTIPQDTSRDNQALLSSTRVCQQIDCMANRSFLGKKTKQKAIPERGELHLLMAGERLAATAVQEREGGGGNH